MKTYISSVLRYLTFPYAVRYDVPGATEKAQEYFLQYLKDCKNAQNGTTLCTKYFLLLAYIYS